MEGAYFLLASGSDQPSAAELAGRSAALRTAGLHLRMAVGAVNVFTSREMRTLQLPSGGVIVGDLYSCTGEPIKDAGQLTCPPSGIAVRQHMLENCWGDYIVLLPGEDDSRTVTVMRSPSHACGLPCVFSLHDEGFVTSHVSLAVRLGLYRKRVDFDYMAHRLFYPDLKTSRTGLAGIRELLPGCTLLLRNGRARIDQHWSPWKFVDAKMRYADPGEAASAIRNAIAMVVSTWANHDESVLLELSGGLDSSIVGACLKQSQATVACSTLTTPVPGGDERDYGGLIAHLLGVELSATELRYDDAPFRFPVPQEFATPAIGPLQYAIDRIMEAAAKRTGANTYFSGAGGDTVFCYLTNAAPAADAFREAGLSTGIQAIHDLSTFHQCTYWKAGRLTLRKLLRSKGRPYAFDRSLLSPGMSVPEPELHPWLSQPTGSLPGDRQRIFELSAVQFFPDSCPRGLTRRVRMPLLSQPVIEACLRAPSWMWFSDGRNRALARDAFSDMLPPAIFERKSKGSFTAYLGALYRRKAGAMIGFLLDGELQARGLLDADALRQLADGGPPRSDGPFMRVFLLCTLENWVRQQSLTAECRPTWNVR